MRRYLPLALALSAHLANATPMNGYEGSENRLGAIHSGPASLPGTLHAGNLSISGVGPIRKLIWKTGVIDVPVGIDNPSLNTRKPAAVPEPGTLALLGLGLPLLLLGLRRRRAAI